MCPDIPSLLALFGLNPFFFKVMKLTTNLFRGYFAEGRLFGIILHLHHALLHGLDVADELDELLDPGLQTGLGLWLGLRFTMGSGTGGSAVYRINLC